MSRVEYLFLASKLVYPTASYLELRDLAAALPDLKWSELNVKQKSAIGDLILGPVVEWADLASDYADQAITRDFPLPDMFETLESDLNAAESHEYWHAAYSMN